MSQDYSKTQAYQKSLNDLGDAAQVAQRLKYVHIFRQHYKWAIFACAAMLLLFFMIPLIAQSLNTGARDYPLLYVGLDVLLVGVSIFILNILRQLFIDDLNLAINKQVFMLIIFGLSGQVLGDGLTRIFFEYPIYEESLRTFSTTEGTVDRLLLLITVGSRVAVGIGLIQLSWQILKAKVDLYNLGKPFGVLCALLGTALATFHLFTHLQTDFLAYLVYAVMLITHALLWPVLILVFYRQVYRKSEEIYLQTA